jgi:hypothetical protein
MLKVDRNVETRTYKLAYVDKHSTLNICHAGKFDKHNKFSTFVHFWPAIHFSRHVDVTPSFTQYLVFLAALDSMLPGALDSRPALITRNWLLLKKG